MSTLSLEISRDIRLRALANARMAEARQLVRPAREVVVEIDRAASTRCDLYRKLSLHGPDVQTREQVAALGRRLDWLYEELRISRMVAA